MANIKYLYVADVNNGRVVKLRADNLAWTRESQTTGPYYVTLSGVQDTACDSSYVYVVDQYHGRVVSLLLTNLAPVAEVSFYNPLCVAVYGGYLYVGGQINRSNTAIASINKYSIPGMSFVSQTDMPIDPALPLWYGFVPFKIATDGTYMYVADDNNHRLAKLLLSDFSLVTFYKFTPPGWPATIGGYSSGWLKPSAVTTDGTHLYVTDVFSPTKSHVVKLLCSDLSYVSHVGIETPGIGNENFYRPSGIYYDAGFLYVADSFNARIQKRNASDLSFVSKTGSYGARGAPSYDDVRGINVFYYPWGLAIGESEEEMFITKEWNYLWEITGISKTWTVTWDIGKYVSKVFNYLYSIVIENTGSGIVVSQTSVILSAFLSGQRKILLSWTFGSNADFQVFWKSSSPPGQEYVLLAATNAFSYTTADLDPSKTYYFYVRANVGATYFYSNVVELFVSCGKGVVLEPDPPPSPDSQPLNYFGAGYTWGVAVNSGYLYFTDNWNHKVIKMQLSKFTQQKCSARWGTYGSGDGQLNYPTGIATDGTYLYVYDQENSRIQKFTMSFLFVSKVAAPRNPSMSGLGINYANGRLYHGYSNLRQLDTSLAILHQGLHAYNENCATEDASGQIYADGSVGGFGRIVKLSWGSSNWTVGTALSGWSDRCDGIYIDSTHVYFSDYYGNRVGRFDLGTMANLTFTPGWFDQPFGLSGDSTHVYVGTSDGRVGRFTKSPIASPEFTFGTWQPAIGSYMLAW